MGATPARLLIEAFFLPLYAIPAKVMQTIIGAHRFNDVRSLSIASLAAISCAVFSGDH
jgi:hypothetical protein